MKEGVVLVNKPQGWSSQKTVIVVRKKLGIAKAGHAGALDPAATGLLVVLLGSWTKRFESFKKMEKEYEAEITFGEETDTWDGTGRLVKKYNGTVVLDEIKIRNELKKLVGKVLQTPPRFSALKVNGVTAYKRALRGEDVELKPRWVEIKMADLISIEGRKIKVLFRVSSGTYIRSLAYELGRKLGWGGYLSRLIRKKVGAYSLERAKDPDMIGEEDILG